MAYGNRLRGICACLCACAFSFSASAIEYVFPPGAGVVDITKALYSADRTGATDVSAILTKAANDIINVPGWGAGILYLPNGTYLVKNTFSFKVNSSGSNGVGPHVVGQSRTGTVIKLAKGTWPAGTELKGVIWTGTGVEQNFNKGIQNLTVLVDSNNAGAIGIIYVSNNNGLVSDVDIISADGKGAYGIQSAWGLNNDVSGNGPFLIRRTYIKGFQVGFRGCAGQSETMSQIRLEGQGKYGLWVTCSQLTVDSLVSNDTCPAIQAEGAVLLTHGVLSGGSRTQYAIRNFSNASYFCDVLTSGYRAAIQSAGQNPAPTGSLITEYTPVAPVSLFSTQKTSMKLPGRYPPDVPWENDFTKWAYIEDYKTGGRTDVAALQATIDDPAKTTICLVRSKVYQIDQPVYLRGNIGRIYAAGGMFHKVNSNGMIIVDNGTAPVVTLQKVSVDNASGDPGPCLPVVKRTNRTLVLETLNMTEFHIEGGGETYISDITSGNDHIDNAQARVWLWQWCGAPMVDSTLIVSNGVVRSVGYYDEGWGSMLFCLGGITEVLGYWDYNGCTSKSGDYLMTVGNNANVSMAGVWQQNFCNPWAGYTELVSETRGSTTKILYNAAGSGRVASPAGGNIALFTAYDSVQVWQALNSVAIRPAAPAAKGRTSIAVRPTTAGMEVLYRTATARPVTLIAHDLAGRIITVVNEHPAAAGMHRTILPKIAGIVCVRLRTQGETARYRMVVHQ